MNKPENPQAFPCKEIADDFGVPRKFHHPGMTLRDYIAANTLAALASGDIDYEYGWPEYARQAYLAADAMLAERAKGAAP